MIKGRLLENVYLSTCTVSSLDKGDDTVLTNVQILKNTYNLHGSLIYYLFVNNTTCTWRQNTACVQYMHMETEHCM